MEHIQFTAIVLMSLLTLKLLLLPSKVTVNPIIKRAWWLMTVGIALIDVQFLLQYILGLRALGITQAVMLNLALFIPASWLLSISIICLQRRGFISRRDQYAGLLTWGIAMGLLAFAAATDDQPLLAGSPEMRQAEIVASVFYTAMMAFYMWRHLKNMRLLLRALKNYYDEDLDDLLRWMRVRVIMLPILGSIVPLIIFTNGSWLFFFGLLMFLFIFFLVDSFFNYVVSSAPARIQEAEEHEDDEEADEEHSHADRPLIAMDAAPMQRVEHAVEKWVANGGYLRNGIKQPSVAEELGVPRYQLTMWLHNQNLKYADWITELRIEEAKHILGEHPEWSTEAISQHCGFSDRSYFQRKFKEKTGLSPSDYQTIVGNDIKTRS